jgi:hypothetical protein
MTLVKLLFEAGLSSTSTTIASVLPTFVSKVRLSSTLAFARNCSLLLLKVFALAAVPSVSVVATNQCLNGLD